MLAPYRFDFTSGCFSAYCALRLSDSSPIREVRPGGRLGATIRPPFRPLLATPRLPTHEVIGGKPCGLEGHNKCCPWLTTFSGLSIMLAVLSFNIMGDALRDLLDPRLRGD